MHAGINSTVKIRELKKMSKCTNTLSKCDEAFVKQWNDIEKNLYIQNRSIYHCEVDSRRDKNVHIRRKVIFMASKRNCEIVIYNIIGPHDCKEDGFRDNTCHLLLSNNSCYLLLVVME